jgi:hypothetical protein
MASADPISPSFCNAIREIIANHRTLSINVSQPSASVSGLTPLAAVGRPLAMSPPWMANELRHQPLRTPPTTVDREAMITPEIEQTYRHVSTSTNANCVYY